MAFLIEAPEKGDMHILVPNELVGDGETGDEFPDEFKTFLRCLCMTGWWPVDIGNGDETHTELWLKKAGLNEAKLQVELFIKMGGDV